jgi:hypothetical protein
MFRRMKTRTLVIAMLDSASPPQRAMNTLGAEWRHVGELVVRLYRSTTHGIGDAARG